MNFVNFVKFGNAENTLPLNGYAMGEFYNLKTISVSYDSARHMIVVIMPSSGEMLLQIDVNESWEHEEDSPQSVDVVEWKEYILSKEYEVEFLHDSMIRSIVRKQILLENNLSDLVDRETKKFLDRLGE